MSKEFLEVNPKVVFPCSVPKLGMGTITSDDVGEALEEIENLSEKITFSVGLAKCSSLKIEVVTELDDIKNLNSKYSNRSLRRTDYYLIFSGEMTMEKLGVVDLKGSKIKMTSNQEKSFYEQSYSEEFASEVIYFLFLTNLAKVGRIFTNDGIVVYPSGQHASLDRVACFLDEAIEISEKIKWSQIKKLDMLQVWNWTNSFSCGQDRFGHTPVGRALCAFSNLFNIRYSNTDEALKLFWAMVGLEALYTDGKGDLTHQLAEKTQIILGEQIEFKKIVKKMYAYRSKFVHGDAPFPSYFFESDAMLEYENFSDEVANAANMATAILVATLQYLIERDWKELSFKYSVNNPKDN